MKSSEAPRVVLDTNLVLSSLVFAGGRLNFLRQAWQARRFTPLVCRQSISELIRVLAYPKFELTPAERKELLADYLPWCMTLKIPSLPPLTPQCRDPADQVFLHLAVTGKAAFLVTGDKDLLALAGQFDCPIISAEDFRLSIGAHEPPELP